MTSYKKNTPRTLTAFALAFITSQQAHALNYDVGDVHMAADTKISAGMAWRVEKPDKAMIGIANGGTAFSTNHDDADLLYSSGDLVSGITKVTTDLSLSYHNSGIFVRGSAGWNGVTNSQDLFDAADYGTGKGYAQSVRLNKEHEVQAHNGSYTDLLDAYLYTTQNIAGHSVALRAGRQVVNWGENTFVANGLNSLLAFDANRMRSPGRETEEFIIPTNQVWVSAGLGAGLNLEGFYQLQWERSIADATGTFWNANDHVGIGANAANLGFGRANENSPGTYIPRNPDVDAKDSGQYGAALRASLPILNNIEVAFYGANYHSRLPVLSGVSAALSNPPNPATARYFAEYPEDIKMYGTSFNTTIPYGWSLQGEYSFKEGQPIQIDDIELLLAGLGAPSQIKPAAGSTTTLGGKYIQGWRGKNVSQYDLGLTRLFGPSQWLRTDGTMLMFETALTHVHDMEDESVLRYDGPATDLPGNAAIAAGNKVPQQKSGYATATSWGYKTAVRLEYANVFNFVTVKPTIRFEHDVNGVTPAPLLNFLKNRRLLGTNLGLSFHNNITADIGYTRYFGGGITNLLQDRDFAEASVKYSF